MVSPACRGNDRPFADHAVSIGVPHVLVGGVSAADRRNAVGLDLGAVELGPFRRWCLIDATKEGSIYDSMERLNEIRGWMLKNLTELKKVLNPLLEKIQAEMEG